LLHRPIHSDNSYTSYTISLSTEYDNGPYAPGTGGGNYVDVDLQVVIKMATDTVLVR